MTLPRAEIIRAFWPFALPVRDTLLAASHRQNGSSGRDLKGELSVSRCRPGGRKQKSGTKWDENVCANSSGEENLFAVAAKSTRSCFRCALFLLLMLLLYSNSSLVLDHDTDDFCYALDITRFYSDFSQGLSLPSIYERMFQYSWI